LLKNPYAFINEIFQSTSEEALSKAKKAADSFTGLVGFYEIQPIPVEPPGGTGDDFHQIAMVQFSAQWYRVAVDLGIALTVLLLRQKGHPCLPLWLPQRRQAYRQ
jgi:hypothetical protein